MTALPRQELTARQRYMTRLAALKAERETWIVAWRELSEYISPRRSRFLNAQPNRGTRVDAKIINSKAGMAARTQSAGMMASISSPARVWFRIAASDSELREVEAIKGWCAEVEERIRNTIAKSNIYKCLHNVYSDLGTFGTTAFHIEEDEKSVIRGYVFPIGSYSLSQSARMSIDTCYREYSMTVRQMVEDFGIDKVSHTVRDAHARGALDDWHQVVFVVEPNPKHEPGKIGREGMAFHSCWFEASGGSAQQGAAGTEGFLREGGFEENPILTPRWRTTGEDVYGDCPGMEAIGDVKELQLLERRSTQAFEKVVNPPMRAPTSLIGHRSSLLPGDVTHVDSNAPGQTFAPAMEINHGALDQFRQKIRELELRIEQAYYADLWLTMQRLDSGKMTATEVSARQQEQMLLLGPVMEALQDELLDPLIDRVFGILFRKGLLPPVPEEFEGIDLKVEYVSIMATAQKLLGTTNIERLMSFVGNLVAVVPDAMDKIDVDRTIDEYGDALAVPPDLVRSREDVDKIRGNRAQQAAQAQAQEQAGAMVEGAKVLSETDLDKRSALTEMLGHIGPPGGAQGIR